jgi:hypothetical protein
LAPSSQGNSAGANIASYLRTAGDTMIGPLAFWRSTDTTIYPSSSNNNTLDVSSSTGAYSSHVIWWAAGSNTLEIISGAAFNGQILFLESTQTLTQTIKDRSNTSGGNTGNIKTLDGNDLALGTDKTIVLLMYSDVDESWHQVSNPSSGSSSWVGTATSDLNMATYDIQGVDTVYFNASGTSDATIDGSTAGLSHNVATGDVHTFQINSNTKLQITNTAINVYEDIDSDSGATFAGSVTINGAVALGNASTDLIFASGRFNTSLIPNTDNDVDLGSSTNEWRHLYVDGTANLDTISAGATTTNTLFTTSTTSLGDGDTDQINFYGMTDWKNNTTASSASTGNREGYITIKINGTEKKLYYYA